MSTPAAQALSGTAAPAAAPATAAPPAATPPPGPASGSPPANEGFWKDWNAPEQKDTRDWITNKNYPDTFTLAKTAQGLEREAATLRAQANLKGYPADKVNPDGTVIKADDNARKAWNATMGVPETADKYQLANPGGQFPEFTQVMAEGMLEAGVPAAMAQALQKVYETATQKTLATLKAQEDAKSQEGLLELQRDWGSKYQENLALANRARTFFTNNVPGLTAEKERQMEAMLGTPTWLGLLQKIGAGNREAGFAGSNSPSDFGNGASQAQIRLDQATADRSANRITKDAFDKIVGEVVPIIAGGMHPQQ